MTTPFCIQCHDRPAKWKELKCQENTYCGRLCQLQYHLVGGDIVGLEGRDGTQIRITLEHAREMQALEWALEDLNLEDDDYYIPLTEVNGNILKRIEEFLSLGVVETKDMNNQEFIDLLKAAKYLEFERLYMYLINQNTNLNITRAAANGELEAVKLLLQNPRVDITLDDNEPIRLAAENGHSVIVELLLKNGADPSALNNYAIGWAAQNGHLEVVKLLLQDSRVDPTADSNFAIRRAAESGYLEIVDLLLKNGADPTAWDNFAIEMAADNGHLAVVELLLQDPRVDPEVLANSQNPDIQELYLKYRRKKQRIKE